MGAPEAFENDDLKSLACLCIGPTLQAFRLMLKVLTFKSLV
jgi:hypothetical protein